MAGSVEGQAVIHSRVDMVVGVGVREAVDVRGRVKEDEGKRKLGREMGTACSAPPPQQEHRPPVLKPWGLCVLFK